MKLIGTPDTRPAHLTLDADRVRYRFDGFGGNYCFGIESPVTQYTLDHLKVAWARTEMSLALWEPENDNESPDAVSWEAFERRDTPDSRLRREWLLMKQIQDKGIPYVISALRMPQWLTEPAGRGSESRTRRLRPEMWPEMLEAVGSYLLYANEHYGVEPNLFSFNEANIGVDLLLSPEEHRQMIKCLGAHLKKLGLKTKMLLGDTGSARGTHTYCLPAANDPEAMQYVGAVAFHSWGGVSPEDYQAWSDLADRLKLPLLDTELGVDAVAYRDRSYDSFFYATREVEMYQDVILHARVQGTQQWEFTNDYSIVHETKDAAGKTLIEPTARFHFVKQFCNLTPVRVRRAGHGKRPAESAGHGVPWEGPSPHPAHCQPRRRPQGHDHRHPGGCTQSAGHSHEPDRRLPGVGGDRAPQWRPGTGARATVAANADDDAIRHPAGTSGSTNLVYRRTSMCQRWKHGSEADLRRPDGKGRHSDFDRISTAASCVPAIRPPRDCYPVHPVHPVRPSAAEDGMNGTHEIAHGIECAGVCDPVRLCALLQHCLQAYSATRHSLCFR